ncbi:MAG: DUF167 domain-containing protein [Fimbriimonadaceae bacterium]|nr:MAG: DUF167 domain-containing protein [Fimbriimonadaceae bacterium]
MLGSWIGKFFCLIEVRVNPRSTRERMEVCADGTFKVWVNAPPVDGEANLAVCRLVAKQLNLAPSRVTLHKGEKSRNKVLYINGLNRIQVDQIVSGGSH